MTRSQSCLFIFVFSVIFASCLAADESKVRVSYSFPSTQLTLHEPVVLMFKIDNESTQVVKVDLGQDRKSAFLFTVTSPDRTSVHLPELKHNGVSRVGNITVQPGGAFTQR